MNMLIVFNTLTLLLAALLYWHCVYYRPLSPRDVGITVALSIPTICWLPVMSVCIIFSDDPAISIITKLGLSVLLIVHLIYLFVPRRVWHKTGWSGDAFSCIILLLASACFVPSLLDYVSLSSTCG